PLRPLPALQRRPAPEAAHLGVPCPGRFHRHLWRCHEGQRSARRSRLTPLPPAHPLSKSGGRPVLTSRHLAALGALIFSATLLSACKSEPEGCPDDLEYFRTRLWEPVMSVQCIACHKADGVAQGTRMVLLPPDAPGAVERNFMTVRALAREKVNDVP